MAITKHTVLFFQAGKDSINRKAAMDLQSQFDSVIKSPKEDTEIDMWIDSPGGDAHATYKMWLDLRSRARKLRAWVPDYAKSAATLFVLGFDEIYMGPSAELGPLDVQIEHPDRENITISALDVANSLEYLSRFSLEFAINGGACMVQCTHLQRTDVLREILPFAAKMIEPCVDKIDPHLTRRAVYQLKVAEHYAERMLEGRNVPKGQLDGDSAENLIRQMVHEYPVHECVIGRQEARDLGLPIFDAEVRPEWPAIKAIYEKFMAGKDSLVVVLPPDTPKVRIATKPKPAKSRLRVTKKAKKKTTEKRDEE